MSGSKSPRAGHLSVASVTMSCHQDPGRNLEKVASLISTTMAQYPETNLIVFGEMILGWYDPDGMRDYHRESSIHVSHDSLGMISDLASAFGIYVCMGFSENDGGYLFNSQILFDRRGDPRSIHRKHNLKPAEVRCGYHPGRKAFTITRIMGLKVAMVICSDLARLSTIRKLSFSRPDLIILALADDEDPGFAMARCNARLYDSWIVSANRFGPEDDRSWDGHTVISSPWGRLVQTSVGSETVLAHRMKMPSRGNLPLRLFRKLVTRTPLPFMVMANWKRLKGYF